MSMPLMILTLALITSCGGHLTLSTRGCDLRRAMLGDGKGTVLVDTHMWHKTLAGEKHVVYLRELLEARQIECARLKTVSYHQGQSFFDQLLSLVPFVRRSHVVVRGELINN